MNGLNFLYNKASNVNFSTIPARLQSQGSVVLGKTRDFAVRILSNFRGLSIGQQLGIGFAVVGGGLGLIALGRHLPKRKGDKIQAIILGVGINPVHFVRDLNFLKKKH